MYSLFFLSFSLLFFYTQGVSYQECLDNNLLNYNIIATNSSDIIGGRGEVCNISCAQRYYYDFICYSDVGFYYDIWYWILWFIYFITLCWVYYCSYKVYVYDKRTIKLGPQNFTLLGALITIILRFIWLCGIYNGRTPDVFNNIVLFDVILSKIVQSLHLLLFLGIILVWRNIVQSTTTLTKIDNNHQMKIFKCISIIYLIMAIILVPFSVGGQIWSPRLNIVTGVVFMGFLIGLIISSIKYSFAINKILNNQATIQSTIQSTQTKNKNIIHSISITNRIFLFFGLIDIVYIICIYFRLFTNPLYKLYIQWLCLHIFESIFLMLFAYSVSFRARSYTTNNINNSSITQIQQPPQSEISLKIKTQKSQSSISIQ